MLEQKIQAIDILAPVSFADSVLYRAWYFSATRATRELGRQTVFIGYSQYLELAGPFINQWLKIRFIRFP